MRAATQASEIWELLTALLSDNPLDVDVQRVAGVGTVVDSTAAAQLIRRSYRELGPADELVLRGLEEPNFDEGRRALSVAYRAAHESDPTLALAQLGDLAERVGMLGDLLARHATDVRSCAALAKNEIDGALRALVWAKEELQRFGWRAADNDHLVSCA